MSQRSTSGRASALWPAYWEKPATWRVWAKQAGIGALLGLVLVAFVFAVEYAAGWLRVVGVAATGGALVALAVGLGRALLVGVIEEAIFRGVLLGYLRAYTGTPVAVVISAAAFGLVHAWNANVTPLAIVNLAAAGLLFALAFLVSRGLALPIGLHAGWNWFEGWVFGFPLSGKPQEALLTLEVQGPEWATGGAFGPEGGVVGLLAMGLVALLLVLLRGVIPTEPSS